MRVSIRRTFVSACPRNKQSGNKKQTQIKVRGGEKETRIESSSRRVFQKEMAKQVVLQFQDPFQKMALRGSEGHQEQLIVSIDLEDNSFANAALSWSTNG
ncbi:hypothetical protein CDAR_18981 [Caerostris darwini]|uniref:Uncharacterized protein n=1 Tax=Caerostris darwini TaxID=1538125 RepID=A0AAV4WBJ7_9ARAC|nr:hypothetical protein CDAR_18981 [Caerostris darwini]